MHLAITLIAAFVAVAAESDAQNEYTLKAGERLSSLPCSAFKRNSDGSWTQTGTVTVEPGNITLSGNTFKGSGEAKEIDAKCGPK